MKFRSSSSRSFASDDSGFYIMFLAGAIFALLAVMGLAVDVGMLEAAKLRLQRAVDASSIAATYLLEERTRAEIETLARQLVLDNLYQTGFDPSEVVGTPTVILEPAAPSVPRVVKVSAVVRPPLKILQLVPWIKTRPTVFAEAQSNNVRVAVALVLDRSGSMDESMPCGAGVCNKLAELKGAAIKFVDQFSSDDWISVVSFASDGSVDFPIARTPADKTVLHQRIDDLESGGYTNTYEGIKLAREQINSVSGQMMPFDFRAIVLVSDGAPFGGPSTIPVGLLKAGCTLPNNAAGLEKKRYLAPIAEADNARKQASPITLFAVGLGQPGVPEASAPCLPCDPNNHSGIPCPIPVHFNQNDPYQCSGEAWNLVKTFFFSRLVNDQESMAYDPSLSPPQAQPLFPESCIEERTAIAPFPRGKFYQTANPADLDDLLLSIGRSIKARLTK